ncbi:MAG: hypothetical protein K2G36_07805 [Ruminococcus sp.]|nr:hypothetical protein [Ruminococcus sp.]
MDKESLYNALTDIDEKYISESENFSEISAEFRRAELRKIGTVFSVCGFCVIIVTAVFFSSGNRNIPHITTENNSRITESSSELSEIPASADNTDTPVTEEKVTESATTDPYADAYEPDNHNKSDTNQLISADGEYLSFAETFGYYGAETSADISAISYTINVPENGISVITEQGVISDYETINSIVTILNSLSPETATSATPQWYIDAWNDYKANPSAYHAESIMIEICLENGTVIKDITYQPFLADGYISGMQELTSEQNTMLRSLLQK